MDRERHWQDVYQQKQPHEVSWYRQHLDQSLALIAECKLPAAAAIVDVGGGASSLIDDLLQLGFTQLTVIDLASAALAQTQARLGERAASVRFVQGDVTTPLLAAESVELWHDRAVFHFLTDERARAAYLEQVARCLRPGGYVVIGTFAPDGPERCSGLPVRRYAPKELAEALGPSFELLVESREEHVTPAGKRQPFSYVLCRRSPDGPAESGAGGQLTEQTAPTD